MKNTTDLQKKILEKIKSGQIQKKPRSFFVIKNTIFWVLSFFFIVFGAISFASVLYRISGDFEIIENMLFGNLHFSETVLHVVPFFWLFLLILFLYIAIANYKKTKLFYRVNLYIVILIAVITSFVMGIFMFHFGLAQKTEEFSERYIPFYTKYIKIQNIKKDIFVKKLREIGVTKEILDQNPDLKKKVTDKFDLNVLGKKYLYTDPLVCTNIKYTCSKDEVAFSDDKGCGCREVHTQINK